MGCAQGVGHLWVKGELWKYRDEEKVCAQRGFSPITHHSRNTRND